MKIKSHILICGTNVCRFIIAIVFLCSGLVKAIDPSGTQYKIQDYLTAFGLQGVLPSFFPLIGSVGMAVLEFLIGALFFFGIRRTFASIITIILLAIYTPLTLYIAIKNPVADCGCFGDALILTNWQTFYKNIFLLVIIVFIWYNKDKIVHFVSDKLDWLVSLYSALYVFVLACYCLYYSPVLDFLPYKIGTNIPKAMVVPPGKHLSELETLFTLRKGGVEKEFVVDNYPDSTWKFVKRRTIIVKKGYQPSILRGDFAIYDMDSEEDISEKILSNPGYTFLLVLNRVEKADDSRIDVINGLYDYCIEHKYDFYALTSSDDDQIDDWRDKTGAEYSFFHVDDTVLREMVRTNLGIILLKNGTILNKWGNHELFDEEVLSNNLENLSIGQQSKGTNMKNAEYLLLWFLIPLILIILVDLALFKKKNNINPLNKSKMRKNIVAGNWKMNKTLQEGIVLAKELNEVLANDKPNCDVVICTPFIHLASITPLVDSNKIGVGAENCADKESGAYTGEISAAMVASTGAKYVILGHSERRAYYGETVETLKAKVKLALANNLIPIFCVGEKLDERESNKQEVVVASQLESVFGLSSDDFKKIIIAYEPVWAIGTGRTATSAQAEDIHKFIRSAIAKKYDSEVADNTSILYGGSCKPSNAKELFAQPDVDGGLIGGAALNVADFKGIIDAFKA